MREVASELAVAAAGGAGAWCVVLIATTLVLVRHARGWADARLAAPWSAHKAVEPVVDDSADEAKRSGEASKTEAAGCATCGTCGFENLAAARRCVICGGRRLGGPDASEAAASDCPVVIAATDNLRTRKRKEWSRHVDAHGRRFWRRHRIAGNDDRSDGYVLKFDMVRSLQPLREPEPVTSDAKEITSPRTQTANAAFSAALGYQMSNVRLELLDAMGADPMKLPHDVFGSNGNTFSLASSISREDLFKQCMELATKDFPTKYEYFTQQAVRLRESHQSFQTLRQPSRCSPIRRDYLMEQSLELINCADEYAIQSSRIPVTFLNQEVGELAAHREWLARLSGMLADPLVGLFRCTNSADRGYFINPTVESVLGDDHLLYYYAAGRLMGHMLLNGELLDFHLAVPLLKMMLGTPISFSDLEYLDEEKYRNLLWLLDHDDVQELELDFTVNERAPGGEVATIELIPAGRKIQVNDDNKYEYIDRVFRHVLFESVSTQVCVLLKGFYEAVPQEHLLLFDYQELDYLLCGADDIDVDEWRQHAHCEGDQQVVSWFWEAVYAMSNDRRRGLLRFSTGSARVPLVGFRGLSSYDGRPCPFTLKVTSGTDEGVRSHACFNTLELPVVASKQQLVAVLGAAIDAKAED